MGKQYLVTYKGNWADELDVSYAVIVGQDEIDRINQIKEAESVPEVSVSIGSNQEIDDVSVYDFKITEISEELADSIKKLRLVESFSCSFIESVIEYSEDV